MRRPLQTLLVVGLGVGLMAFFLGSADLGRVWLEMRNARWGLVLLAALVSALSYVVRVVRWQQMLSPIGPGPSITALSPAFKHDCSTAWRPVPNGSRSAACSRSIDSGTR